MEMIPHERELVKRLKDRPFVLLGVNGDDDRAKAAEVMTKEAMTWPSLWNGGATGGIVERLGVGPGRRSMSSTPGGSSATRTSMERLSRRPLIGFWPRLRRVVRSEVATLSRASLTKRAGLHTITVRATRGLRVGGDRSESVRTILAAG